MGQATLFPKKVLLTTDFSEASLSAFRYALDQAKGNGAQLEVLCVVQSSPLIGISVEPVPSVYDIATIREAARTYAEKNIKEIAAKHLEGVDCTTKVVETLSPVAETIIKYANEQGHGLVIIATHGHGLAARAVLGSVAERVARTAECPVLVVPSQPRALKGETASIPFRRILVLTDFSPVSQSAFALASHEAKRCGAKIILAHVVERPYPPEVFEREFQAKFGDAGAVLERYRTTIKSKLEGMAETFAMSDISTVVLDKFNSIPHTLTEFARDNACDLIIMAAKGSGNALTWIGGTAERVIRDAPCPVLLVHSRSSGSERA